MITEIRSHKDARGNIASLLLIPIYGSIIYLVVEEDVVEIINTANAPLLRESAELVVVHEDFLVLLLIDILASFLPGSDASYISYISSNTIIQLIIALIKDIYI